MITVPCRRGLGVAPGGRRRSAPPCRCVSALRSSSPSRRFHAPCARGIPNLGCDHLERADPCAARGESPTARWWGRSRPTSMHRARGIPLRGNWRCSRSPCAARAGNPAEQVGGVGARIPMRRARGESGLSPPSSVWEPCHAPRAGNPATSTIPPLRIVERAVRRAGSPGRGAAVRPGPAAVHSEALAVTRWRFRSTMLTLIPRTCAS